MRIALALALLLAALAFGAVGCGGDDGGNGDGNGNGNDSADSSDNGSSEEDEEYPQVAIDNFVESCTAQPGATDSECECAIDELQAEVPFSDFKKVDEAIREGRTPPAREQEEINDAVAQCRE